MPLIIEEDLVPVPPEPITPRSAEIVTLLDNVELNNTTTAVNSESVAVGKFRRFLLYLEVESSGTPTTVQFIVQFQGRPGGKWHDYKQGPFASLYYEDQDTADGVAECFSGEVAGRSMRVRAVGTGTSATNTFTVSAAVEFYA